MSNFNESPLRAARLTPSGAGGVAVVGVSGDSAWQLLRERWTRADGRAFEHELGATDRPIFGFFHFDALDGVADEVVLRRRTSRTFELDCHGGELVSGRILDYFRGRGAEIVSGHVWERAVEEEENFFAGKSGDFSSEVDSLFFATIDELLSQTTTEETARIACDQRYSWREWFEDFLDKARRGAHAGLVDQIDVTLNAFSGRYLTEPFLVAFTGAPNVGKSSLLNAILGYDRAVASPVSGTTRDLVGAAFVYGGWNYLLVDAAGLRETEDPLELAGIKLASELVSRANVVVRVFDPTQNLTEQQSAFERFLPSLESDSSRIVMNVVNKADLATSSENKRFLSNALHVSALDGSGIESFLEALFAETVAHRGGPVDSSQRAEALLWREDQRTFLEGLRERLISGSDLISIVNAVSE